MFVGGESVLATADAGSKGTDESSESVHGMEGVGAVI